MFKRSKKKNTSNPTELAKKLSDKAIELQGSSSKHVGRYLRRRSDRIQGVRRFMFGWLALATLLCLSSAWGAFNLYAKSHDETPTSGGTYIEGMTGEVNNLNPLFSTGKVDSSAHKLLFNGLLRFDEEGQLTTDLAKSWQVGKDQKTYTVTLRDDVSWHDGQPFTAKDVLFTIQTIQDPATRSALFASWQDITVRAQGDHRVSFTLPAPFAPFSSALTTAILPAHLLEEIKPNMLRTTDFSSHPVGTGPFEMRILRKTEGGQQLELAKNEDYHRGAVKADRFILSMFEDEEDLAHALANREISAAVDLSSALTEQFAESNEIRVDNLPVRNGVFAFMKTTAAPLSDTAVRQALALSIDRQVVLDKFDVRYRPLKTPLLPDQLGYNAKYNQTTNLKQAKQLLDKAGWKLKNGVRMKGKTPLKLKLISVNSAEYSLMSGELQKQWQSIGIDVAPELLAQEQLEQNALTAHSYDILLYGTAIGYDPDVYPYWHSSQAHPGGLNFSEWSSSRADISLELGRTRLNPILRQARYEEFLDEWKKQAPAVALYQPRISYAYHKNASGFKNFPLNTPSARLTNVEDWSVQTRSVRKTP